MKCTKCNTEFSGKFCPNCGTPASSAESTPVQTEQPQPTEPAVNTHEQNEIPQPVQYNPTNDFNGNFNGNVQQEPAQPQQTSFGQQFTNTSKGGYTGQQFTNQPQNNAPSGKKPMSSGKVIALVLGIAGGVLLILCIIVGVVACNIFNAGKELVNKISSSVVSEVEDYTIPDWLESAIEIEEDTTDPETTEPESSDIYSLGMLDDDSHCYYTETEGGVKITGYDNPFEYGQNIYTVNIPSEIDGEDVVEIESMGIYNYSGNDDLYIKVVIPGSVKVIREYAFAFSDDINEVVIEDGVETIEYDAFYDCDDLEKATISKSVTAMDDCGLGFEYDDDSADGTEIINEFVLYGTKGSAAETYAKENNLKFAEAK